MTIWETLLQADTMHNTGYKLKDVEPIILRNGFHFVTQRGSHRKYKRGNAFLIVRSNDINRMIWRRLCREHKLI